MAPAAQVVLLMTVSLLLISLVESRTDLDLKARHRHHSRTTAASSPKVGLAWPNGDDPSLKFYHTDKTKYLYTWTPDCPSHGKELGFNCVPMLWGRNQADHFKKTVVEGYADHVLGFNEPNQVGQAQMSPEEAAKLWQTHIQPLKAKGYKLISPAVTSAPSGKTWMQTFFHECTGCTFDALALHWYDVGAEKFIHYVEDFRQTFQLPIWVTEFACQNFNGGPQCTKAEIFNFMAAVTTWMDSTSYIQAYFAFGVMHDMTNVNPLNQLMASNGQPTDLGKMYIHA